MAQRIFEKQIFNVGDKVRFIDKDFSQYVGQEGIVTATNDEYDRVTYKITKAVTAPGSFYKVGSETNAYSRRLEKVEVNEPAPQSKAKVGDTVYLNKAGAQKYGILRKRMKATVRRAHWYHQSKEWGYYFDIPGVSDIDGLEWIDTFEFYENEFDTAAYLSDVSSDVLKEQKRGTVVWDEDGDKWTNIGKDTWCFPRGGYDTPAFCDSQKLAIQHGPISLIKLDI